MNGAQHCPECGTKMSIKDTGHGGGNTYRIALCGHCGVRIETLETLHRRLAPLMPGMAPIADTAVDARPPPDMAGNPPASAGGVGGGMSEIPIRSDSDPDSLPILLSNPDQTRARRKPRTESPAFVAFYTRFPRKEKRPNACGAWVKHGCDEIADVVMAGLERWMPEFARRAARDPSTIPHPASWLNGKQWNDDPPTAAVDMRCRFHRLPNTRGKMPDRAPPLDGCPECKHAKAASGRRESSPTPISDMLPTWMGEPASADELAALRKERTGG